MVNRHVGVTKLDKVYNEWVKGNKNMKSENCKGCKSDLDPCDPNWVNINGECPCTECLVKAACSILCTEARLFLKAAQERNQNREVNA